MSRPTKSVQMARAAKAAMLAAVEVYNKTSFAYREETFCLLIINAWELLLKARIVQKNNNRLQSIYVRKSPQHYAHDSITQAVQTIGIREALATAEIPSAVRDNVSGLYHLRNEVQHLGVLDRTFASEVLRFGTAAVRNMMIALSDWFDEPVDGVYLFPVGFVGTAPSVPAASTKQRQLLRRLQEITTRGAAGDTGYHIAAEISVDIHASGSGGGTIGITEDPNAPAVQLAEEERQKRFPATYREDLIPVLQHRYSNFKQGRQFNELMKAVKSDPRCTYVRRLDPENPRSGKKEFYNVGAVCHNHLDQHYERC